MREVKNGCALFPNYIKTTLNNSQIQQLRSLERQA